MKRKLLALLLCCSMVFSLGGCGTGVSQTSNTDVTTEVSLTFVGSLYNNSGGKWLEVEGSNFDLKPNKVKQYGYDTSGDWTYWYETSSVVSCFIDGKQLDTCGSTMIIRDKSIEPVDIDLSGVLSSDEVSKFPNVTSPHSGLSDLTWLRIRYWWDTQISNGNKNRNVIVVVQSQDGSPIEMYTGDKVSWKVSELPKTTEVTLDGKKLFLHRSNYAIIDTSLLPTK